MEATQRAVAIGLLTAAILGAGYGLMKQTAVASAPDAALPLPQSARYTAAETGGGGGALSLPRVPSDTYPPVQPASRRLADLAVPQPSGAVPPVPAEADPAARSCEPRLEATTADHAIVLLALDAPCHRDTRVDITHAGLRFSGRTSATGHFSAAVPALAVLASFQATLGGAQAEVTIPVVDAAAYRRLAVQWEGAAHLTLHALEFGADQDGPGHVWAQAPGSPWSGGGSLIRLGVADAAPGFAVAEIYSYPLQRLPRAGQVDLFVQSPVTVETCGTTVTGQVITTRAGRGPSQELVSVQAPACQGTADEVLKKPISEMMIAAN